VLAATADAKSPKPSRSALGKVNQSCVEFNSAFRLAIERLLPAVNRILTALGWKDVTTHPPQCDIDAHFWLAMK